MVNFDNLPAQDGLSQGAQKPALGETGVVASSPSGSAVNSSRFRTMLHDELGAFHFRLRLVNLILFFFPHMCMGRLRTRLYRLCGVRIGAQSILMDRLTLTGPGPILERLQIGADCVINAPLSLTLNADIRIGNAVYIGSNVLMMTADHEIGPAGKRCSTLKARPIVIEDGCWIGAGAMIAPGVTIGQGSVVSMGAVVTMDVPPNKVVGGNPARTIKPLPE